MSSTPNQPTFAPGHAGTEEVLYAVDGRLGRILLNRPRAINALTLAMVDSMLDQLPRWAEDDAIDAVLIEGAGERGLCSGGDIRGLRDALVAGDPEAPGRFFHREYDLNELIATYPKPYVAYMDGVTMGGGVGVSAHGSLRVATERSRIAMPETGIGLYPDVGGLFPLSRAPGGTGTHAALTGAPFGGAEAVGMGFSDVLIETATWPDVVARLREGDVPDPADLGAPAGEPFADDRAWIDRCYIGDDAATIVQALEGTEEERARAAAEVIRTKSPHSVAVTLEGLRRAADLDVHGVLEQDRVIAPRVGRHPDFAEGVRALLVDKDKKPRWADARVEDVDAAAVQAMFMA